MAAWKSIRSWYLVTKEDNAINPDLERFFAKRMGATSVEVARQCILMLSLCPKDVPLHFFDRKQTTLETL